jgi:hypothetical protein
MLVIEAAKTWILLAWIPLEPLKLTQFHWVKKNDFVTSLCVCDRHIFIGSYGSGLSVIHLDPVQSKKRNEPSSLAGSRLLTLPKFTPWAVVSRDYKESDPASRNSGTPGSRTQIAGSVFPLSDDWSTSGAWLGRYGRYWICLCSHLSPYDFQWGASPSKVKYTAQIGLNRKEKDSIRYYVSTLYTNDDRALEVPRVKLELNRADPIKTIRRQSEWDDHGETYDMKYDGPHVYCALKIPAGQFVLSLYNTNKDGHSGMNRFRDYRLLVRTFDDKSGRPIGEELELSNFNKIAGSPIVASSRINDFWYGVWKRFAVTGPCQLVIEVNRNNSFNTILAAVALDEMTPFPAPYFNQKFIRSELEFIDPPGPISASRPAGLVDLIAAYRSCERLRKEDVNTWRRTVSIVCADALTKGRKLALKPQDQWFRQYSLIMASLSYDLGQFDDYEKAIAAVGLKSPREIEMGVPCLGVDEGTFQSGFGCTIIAQYINDLSKNREIGRQFTEPLPKFPLLLGGKIR